MEKYRLEQEESRLIYIRRIIWDVILFTAVSFWEFIYLELFFKKVFTGFPADITARNLALVMLANLILLSIFRSMKATFLISCILMLILGIANFFVISFRGYGIVFMDFYAIKTAMTVAGGYSYSVDKFFLAGCLAALAGVASSFIMPSAKKPYFNRKSVISSLVGIAFALLFIFWINFDAAFFRGISPVTWDHNIGINDYGYLLYFLANAGSAEVDEPSGYSAERVESILSAYADTGKNSLNGKKNPNIIMIMNESFSDLRVLGDFKTDKEVLGFYDSLKENTIKGYVQSSVYGGYTANSEFEFLTGCSKAFLPGNPYLQYMDDYLPSLITNIKSQEGYEEAVAIHPYNASGYNRNRVYPLLGFDRFITLEDFEDPMLVRDYTSDLSDYQKIEELYENKKEGSSLCVFNVTMQNHNPYNLTSYEFNDKINITSFDADVQAEQYLSLMKMSDDALKQLITYFQDVDEPVLVLLFGDHQPHLPDTFYREVMGKDPLLFTQEDTMKKYQVPFLIWANYDIPEYKIERASINYLSSIFLDIAGLGTSSFNRYLMELYKKLPAVSAPGSYDSKGKLHENNERDSGFAELMKEYEIVQYNYLFDDNNRQDRYYVTSP